MATKLKIIDGKLSAVKATDSKPSKKKKEDK